MDVIPIRAATAADVETLVLLRAEFLAELNGVAADDPRLLAALRRYFARAVPAGEYLAYLAEAGGADVATGGLVFHRYAPSPKNLQGLGGYVMSMYTRPAWRGRGLATRVLDLLLGDARRAGCSRVVLHAIPAARPIYARAGFVPVDSEMRLSLEATK